MGDYVVGHVAGGAGEDLTIELPNGRMIEADESDLIVGAFGKRHATLDATGDWEAIGPDGRVSRLDRGRPVRQMRLPVALRQAPHVA